jgi:hypothetical protein
MYWVGEECIGAEKSCEMRCCRAVLWHGLGCFGGEEWTLVMPRRGLAWAGLMPRYVRRWDGEDCIGVEMRSVMSPR